MKKLFKKALSIAGSALMIGATVATAAAAAYPVGFESAAIVVGDSAADGDGVAAVNIANDLAGSVTTVSGSTTVSGGDSVLLERSSDKLNLGDSASTVFVTSLDEDDMPTMLAKGTYTDDDNTEYDYTQKITLGSNLGIEHFSDSDYNDKTPTIGIKMAGSEYVLNYTLDFTTHPAYNASTMETTTLTLMGREYYVLDVNGAGDVSSDYKTTLLDTATSTIVTEGETSTINGKEVSISYIGSAEVKLSVDGSTTNSLAEGATYKLSDGTYVGVKDIMYSSKDTGISKVEISLGTGKLEIIDGAEIELNDDSINEIIGFMVQDSTNKLDKIVLQWTTDDESFIAPDSELVMPGFEALKISMGGFIVNDEEETTVESNGNDVIELKTSLKNGEVTIPILKSNSTGEFELIGKDSDNRLLTSNTTSISFNQTYGDKYIVASWNSSTEAESYYLKVDMVTESSVNKVRFTNEITGDVKKVTNNSDATFGSVTLTVNNVTRDGDAKWADISVNSGGSFHELYTKEGLKIHLPYEAANETTHSGAINTTLVNGSVVGHGPHSFYLYLTEENKDGTLAAGRRLNITLDESGTSNKVHVSAIGVNGDADSGYEVDDSDVFENYATSDLASKTLYNTGGDQDSVVVTYHGDQAYAELYIASAEASLSGTTEVGTISVKDSEVSSVSGRNLIVVGGSCINSVAASLLGSAACGVDFTTETGVSEGQFLIQTFDSPNSDGKMAMLVAGYAAEDTGKAATYLMNNDVDTAKKYVGSSATSADVVIA